MDSQTDFLCNKCRQLLTNPFTFPCGHSFCRNPCISPEASLSAFLICSTCLRKFSSNNVLANMALANGVQDFIRRRNDQNKQFCTGCNFSRNGCRICEHCSDVLCSNCLQRHKSDLIQRLNRNLESLRRECDCLRKSKLISAHSAINLNDILTTELESVTVELKSAADVALLRAEQFLDDSITDEKKLMEKFATDCDFFLRSYTQLLASFRNHHNEYNRHNLCDLLQRAEKLIKSANLLDKRAQKISSRNEKKFEVSKMFTTLEFQLSDFRLITTTDLFNGELNSSSQNDCTSGDKKVSTGAVNGAQSNIAATIAQNSTNGYCYFVEGLRNGVTEKHLRQHFSKFGDLYEVVVTRKQKADGSAYITFASISQTGKEILDVRHVIRGCPLKVGLYEHPSHIKSNLPQNAEVTPPVSTTEKPTPEVNAAQSVLKKIRIFVGQLNLYATEQDLFKYFSKFGDLCDLAVVRNKQTNESRGFGFITFTSDRPIANGILVVEHFLLGSRLRVTMANDSQSHNPNTATQGDVSGCTNALPNDTDRRRIFVGRLQPEISEDGLREYFSKFGKISDAIVMRTNKSNVSRGFGFVTFASSKPVENGILDTCHFIGGHFIFVELATNSAPMASRRISKKMQSTNSSNSSKPNCEPATSPTWQNPASSNVSVRNTISSKVPNPRNNVKSSNFPKSNREPVVSTEFPKLASSNISMRNINDSGVPDSRYNYNSSRDYYSSLAMSTSNTNSSNCHIRSTNWYDNSQTSTGQSISANGYHSPMPTFQNYSNFSNENLHSDTAWQTHSLKRDTPKAAKENKSSECVLL